MQGKRILGLVIMLCLWLVGSVDGVQGARPGRAAGAPAVV